MRELCEVFLGRRNIHELSVRSRNACFRYAAKGGTGLAASCLSAARAYRDRSILIGTPAARYDHPDWRSLGL